MLAEIQLAFEKCWRDEIAPKIERLYFAADRDVIEAACQLAFAAGMTTMDDMSRQARVTAQYDTPFKVDATAQLLMEEL